MDNAEYIERVVAALRKVPPKELKIIELANRFTVDGEFDYAAIDAAQPEINLAVAEAKMYGAHTMMAVNSLQGIEGITSDVGP